MNHLDCPHCGRPAVSHLRKAFMGPGFAARCRMCGEKVGLPYSAARMGAVVSALTLAGLLLARSLASLILILAGGLALGCYLQVWRMPLVPR